MTSRKFNLHAAAVGVNGDCTSRGNLPRYPLAIHENRFHANGRMITGPRRIGLEMHRALDAREPQLPVLCHAAGLLDTSIDLRGFQTVASAISQYGNRL